MIEMIPPWIQAFVIGGIALVILVVPLKVVWEMTKGSRDRTARLRALADRLKERFGAVSFGWGILDRDRIHFTHEGRPTCVVQPDEDEIEIRLEPKVAPGFHVVVRTRGRFAWPIAWESFRPLPRVLTHDPLIDESMAIYASGTFAGYIRDLALQGMPAGGKPEGLAESLIILRRLPGVEKFEFRMSPGGGFRVWFRLRTDDLVYRPDEMESAVHHAFRLYDLLVLF